MRQRDINEMTDIEFEIYLDDLKWEKTKRILKPLGWIAFFCAVTLVQLFIRLIESI